MKKGERTTFLSIQQMMLKKKSTEKGSPSSTCAHAAGREERGGKIPFAQEGKKGKRGCGSTILIIPNSRHQPGERQFFTPRDEHSLHRAKTRLHLQRKEGKVDIIRPANDPRRNGLCPPRGGGGGGPSSVQERWEQGRALEM